MREQKMASYILLKLKYGNMTIEDADEALDSCIRENDIRGISPEGELYLILTQADDKAFPVRIMAVTALIVVNCSLHTGVYFQLVPHRTLFFDIINNIVCC